MTRPEDRRAREERADAAESIWQWIAVGTLLLCWIAEATMCGQRGF
jgi:hypothetical protein